MESINGDVQALDSSRDTPHAFDNGLCLLHSASLHRTWARCKWPPIMRISIGVVSFRAVATTNNYSGFITSKRLTMFHKVRVIIFLLVAVIAASDRVAF